MATQVNTINCSAAWNLHSQLFQSLRCFSGLCKASFYTPAFRNNLKYDVLNRVICAIENSSTYSITPLSNKSNSLRFTTCTAKSSVKTPLLHRQTAFRSPFIAKNTFYFCQLILILPNASNAPFLSVTCAGVMANAFGSPCVSTAICRLISEIFLAAS